MISKKHLARRTFLRGLGTAVALPFLDAMVPALAATRSNPPVRMAFVYVPNGKTFKTPDEMRALLMAGLPQFSRCLTEKMLTYALGRGLKPYDRPTVNNINRDLAAGGYRFQAMVFDIVHSTPFQMGRGEAGLKPRAD